MKSLRLLCILLAIPAAAQIYSGSPAIYPTGQPLANTPMAICNANPGRTTPPCLSTLAQTFSDETLTTACTVLASGGTPGPISGLNCTNPGLAGQLGNWTVYLGTNQNYWAQFYPNGLSPTIVPFTIGGGGGGGGGGSFPGHGWTYVDPVLTAGPTAVLNLQAASSATGFQLPVGNPNTFVPPTQPAGIALDQLTEQINFNDANNENHYLPNQDSLSSAPTTNGIITQAVSLTGVPPLLTTVVLQGNTNDITITNPDGTAGNPVISSATTGVTAGSYTCSNITVNAFGKITAASSSSCTSGSGNTTSTSLVTGNAPTASGPNSIVDSGVGLNNGVETFNGSSSGTITLTPNSNATLLTLGGSGAVTLVTPTGTSSNVALGTSATTGINFSSNLLNYSQGGSNVFSWGLNSAQCLGACNWSGSTFTSAQTFQSGIDTTTSGVVGGVAKFRSETITGGTSGSSGTGFALFGSGDNGATGGASQSVGNAYVTAGAFSGASGASTSWTPGYTIIGQYYWADTTATTNTLGCITTPGTNGQMPKLGTCTVTTNVPWRGAIQSTNGQSVFVVKSGHAILLSNASQTDTAGYFVCLDGSHAGLITVQSTSCTSGQSVGVIDQTGSGGTSHNVEITARPQEIISGGGNTNTSGAVIGDLPVFTGSTTLGDSGFSQSGGTLGIGANGGSGGVLQLNGATSGNATETVSATGSTLTFGGSGFTSLLTPTGTASAVSLGTGANTGIYFASNGLNYSNGGTQVFSAQVNQIQCNGTCAWSANTQTQAQTFQSGLDQTASGSIGGAAVFKSSSVTGGATTGSGSANATFQSGDNAATGGASQTVGDAILVSGGFTGASGASTAWTAGHAGVHQKYWADTTTTAGTLACYTTPGTNGQMPKVGTCTVAAANVPWIGIIVSTTGQSVEVAKLGHVSGVLSNASSTDNAGYFVCVDSSHVGKVLVQSTSCNAGQGIGVIDQTGSGGTSHNVDVNPSAEEAAAGGGGSGTVTSATAGQITYYQSTGTTVVGDSNFDDGATTANTLTYAGTSGISASGGFKASSDGTHPGLTVYSGNTTLPSLPTNTVSIIGPASATPTSWSLQLPTAVPTNGHLLDATVSSTNAVLHDSGVATSSLMTNTTFQSAATNTNIGATNIISTAPSNKLYHEDWEVSLTTVGTGCTGNTTVVLNAIFTDPNTSTPVTVPLSTITLAASGNGTLGFISQGSQAIYAKSGTAVQYSTTSYTAGSGCSVNPSYQVTGRAY